MTTTTRPPIGYVHCDVFAARSYAGNSLAVFPDAAGLSAGAMLAVTRELRHFESIFLAATEDPFTHIARIFDLQEELPFAGHPIIGAACSLHRCHPDHETLDWTFRLAGGRDLKVRSGLKDGAYFAWLDQGRPDVLASLPDDARPRFAAAFGLTVDDFAALPIDVISTGLKYLILPLARGIGRARITTPDLEAMLAEFGAEYAYLFEPESLMGRHWSNDGAVEDAATGSAAGVIGAYAVRHGLVAPGQTFRLAQGRFMGRASAIDVTAEGSGGEVSRVIVGGQVTFVGTGLLDVLP